MKNLLTLCALLLLAVCNTAAANLYSVVAELTGLPADGNTLVVDGVTTTFKTTVTSASTQVLIGATEEETVENLLAHFQDYPLSGVTAQIDPAAPTFLFLVANTVDAVMTESMTGSWGTSDVVITSLTQSPLVLPLVTEPDNQDRTNSANYLVLALRDFSTTNFPANASVLVHFVDDSESQTIDGAKTFRGANIYSNATQVIWGGTITNASAWLNALTVAGTQILSNNSPTIYVTDANGSADNKHTRITGSDGDWTVEIMTDVFGSPTTAIQVRRTGAVLDEIYFGGAIEVAGLVDALSVYAPAIRGVITNATGGFTNIYATNVYLFGALNLTNNEPTINIQDADAATNEKNWRIKALGGSFTIEAVSDDGLTDETMIVVSRVGGAIQNIQFPFGDVQINSLSVNDQFIVSNSAQANFEGIVGIGKVPDISPPAGMTSGLFMTNASASPSADPANAFVLWALAGEPRYRNAGSGANHYAHNLSSQIVGAGSDYAFTTSYAQVTYGSGGNVLSLPTAGTYLVTADVAIENGATANDVYACKLFNATAAADITSSERQISNLPASTRGQVQLQNVVTVAAASNIHLYGKNITAARGSIDSVETKMSYVRLY